MKELMALIKTKMLDEMQKDTINSQIVEELLGMYRRLEMYGVSEVSAVADRIPSLPAVGRPILNRRTDSMFDELFSGLSSIRNMTAPQEVNAILDLRRHYVSKGDEEMIEKIDAHLKNRADDLLGIDDTDPKELFPKEPIKSEES